MDAPTLQAWFDMLLPARLSNEVSLNVLYKKQSMHSALINGY